MVPGKVAEALRRRRLELRMTQTAIAHAIGVSRAYVSAVERGVAWDPDAEKLVAWSRALGWDDGHILGMLGRGTVPISSSFVGLPDNVIEAITQAVAAGIRQGRAEALAEQQDGRPGPDESRPEPHPAQHT
jgi:transcriptional regulator with XRE-family HTH domain